MKKLLGGLLALTTAVGLAACGKHHPPSIIAQNNATINNDVGRLQRAEPLPVLKDSADLRIQNYYYTAEADPSKIWYLVTQGMNGNPTGYYTIRGPVENVSDQVTNPSQIACISFSNSSTGCDSGVVGLAEPNGVYPGSSQDHLAILTDGAILRWQGDFQTSDQPFKVIQTPIVSINENAAISSTNTTNTIGGRIPPRH